MWHRLAGHLKIGTVRETKLRTGMDEFVRWIHYFALEPCGPERGDLQAGMVASTIIRVLGGQATPGDFLLTFEPKAEKTGAQMESFFRNLTKQMGGVVIDGESG